MRAGILLRGLGPMSVSNLGTGLPVFVQKASITICALALVLVLLSGVIIPSDSPVSRAGGCLIVLFYALIALYGPARLARRNPALLSWTVLAGLVSGLVLGGEILLEYIVTPEDNTAFGLVEYGGFILLLFLVALFVGYQSGQVRQGILASIGASMIGSVLWLVVLLTTFYLFWGTAVQEQLFRAEGTLDDFARSGMRDFAAFAVEDTLGACFFHLLLAPIIAATIGGFGGLIGKGIGRLIGTRIHADQRGF